MMCLYKKWRNIERIILHKKILKDDMRNHQKMKDDMRNHQEMKDDMRIIRKMKLNENMRYIEKYISKK
jgi:hypothetical protein